MRRLSTLSVLALLLAACGKSPAERRADVEQCSTSTTSAAAITLCLRGRGGWAAAAAESAGAARARELDSVQAKLNAIKARTDSEHTEEIHRCDQRLVDLKDCLITRFGWVEDSATRTDDSVWDSRSAEHQRQIQSCLGRNFVGTGACLQLHYKWLPRRALALDDSIRRAHLP